MLVSLSGRSGRTRHRRRAASAGVLGSGAPQRSALAHARLSCSRDRPLYGTVAAEPTLHLEIFPRRPSLIALPSTRFPRQNPFQGTLFHSGEKLGSGRVRVGDTVVSLEKCSGKGSLARSTLARRCLLYCSTAIVATYARSTSLPQLSLAAVGNHLGHICRCVGRLNALPRTDAEAQMRRRDDFARLRARVLSHPDGGRGRPGRGARWARRSNGGCCSVWRWLEQIQ